MSFPSFIQLDAMDCGPTSLKMIAQFYGKYYSLQNLRERCHISREGVSLLGISDAAESIGFRTTGVKIYWEQLRDEVNLPCIVHWNHNHFVVVNAKRQLGDIERHFGKVTGKLLRRLVRCATGGVRIDERPREAFHRFGVGVCHERGDEAHVAVGGGVRIRGVRETNGILAG